MIGYENIVEKILDEAKQYLGATTEEAQKSAKVMLDEQTEKANGEKEQLLLKAKDEAEDIKKRMIAMAKLEERKAVLLAKQSLVDEAFETANKQILEMPEKEYLNFLVNICKNISSGDEVLLSDYSFKKVGEQLKAELKTKYGRDVAVICSSSVTDGGLVLKQGNVERNYTVGAIIRHLRDEISDEVVKALF